MNFLVDWADEPLKFLAHVWISSEHKKAITTAQAHIDRLLAADPFNSGFPQREGLYAIEVVPLRASYEILEKDRLVKIGSLSLLR